MKIARKLLQDTLGQDIADYAVVMAVVLILVVGTIKLLGSNANNVFSQIASTLEG